MSANRFSLKSQAIALLISILAISTVGLATLGLRSNPASTTNPNLDILSQRSAQIAEKALPSVVKILVSRGNALPGDKEMESYFGQIPIARGSDIGSGFFVKPGGWLLTSYHVVRGADEIRVVHGSNNESIAKVHAFDILSDLAVLKMDEPKLPHLDWGDSNGLKVGNFIWIAGAPFGLEGSLSFGVVSSMERNSLNGSPLREYIQTDAAINPGNSGGPMLDMDGNVVGVVTSILGDEFRGIGFALPSDMAQVVTQQLIQNLTVKRGWIGIQLGQVTAERAKKANWDSTSGALIEWIDPGENSRIPARKAGLLTGDICIKCNNKKIASQFDLARKIAMTQPGDSLKLELLRDSKVVEADVIVAEKP
jgi:serine protease Do